MPRFHVMYVSPKHPSLGKNGAYAGMNKYAARDLGIPFPYRSNTIVIDRNFRKPRTTLDHEETEIKVYRKGAGQGKKRHYKVAHRITVRKVGS